MWKAHPYRWPVIGWMRDIENISREDCLNYFRTYYAPNNATVFISGDFDPAQAKKLVSKYYGSLKAGPPLPEVIDAEPEQKGERRAIVEFPAQAPSMLLAWRGPKAEHPDTLTLDVLQYALSVGQSSRLTRSLVYEQEVAVSVGVDWAWRFDPGAFVVSMELKPDGKPAEAEAALEAQFKQVAESGLSDDELQKAKNNLSAHLIRELATNGGRAHALGTYEMLLGDWRAGLTLPDRYAAITSDMVKAVVRTYLTPSRRSVATLRPVSPLQEAA
jgi:zinc protease